MGKMGRAICVVCGNEFDIEDMEPIFTGRTRYRCMKCRANGDKQLSAKISASLSHGYAKRLKEREKWK